MILRVFSFFWLFVCIGCTKGILFGQTVNDIGLRGLRHVPQNVLISPSWRPDTLYIGEYRATKGGHFGFDLRSNYLVIQDVFNSLNHNNDINIFRLLNKPSSTFAYTGITTTASLGYLAMTPISRKHNMYLNSSFAVRAQAAINLNGLDVRVFSDATRIKINKNVGRAMSWLDFAIGISGTHRAISYGIRAKYLMGIAYYNDYWNIDATLTEDTTFIRLGGSYFDYGFVGSDPYQGYSPIGHGVAFDIGLSFQISKKTHIDASLLDLGFIGWNQPTSARTVQQEDINRGFTKTLFFTTEGTRNSLLKATYATSLTPTLVDTVAPSIIPLYAQLGIGLKHIFNTKWHTGIMYHTYLAPAAFKYAISAYLTYRFFRGWEFTVNSGLREGGINSLGLGLSHTSNRGQFFLTTENALALLDTYRTKNFHILVGFNFRVGRKSLKLISPVDRLLCADPIIDESVNEEAIINSREILNASITKKRKGHKFNTKYPHGILTHGAKRKKRSNTYRNSYSDIISTTGEEGKYFDRVEYIGEKLQNRELPDYVPNLKRPKPATNKIKQQGKDGDYYNELHNIPLPKRKAPKKTVRDRKDIKSSTNYGIKGGTKKGRRKKVAGTGVQGSTKKARERSNPHQYGASGGRRKRR